MPTYSTLRGGEFWYPYDHPALSRVNTCSSVASDATASNLPGAGRTIGLLLNALGARFETFLNRRAARLRLGPEGVAQKIRDLRGHDEVSIFQRHAVPIGPITEKEANALRRLCKKIIKYSRLALPEANT